jgi:hypothetical protein
MTMRPDRSSSSAGAPAPLDAVSNLSRQIRDPKSALMKGRHTCLALSIELLAAYQVRALRATYPRIRSERMHEFFVPMNTLFVEARLTDLALQP